MKEVLRKAGEKVGGNKPELATRLTALFETMKAANNLGLLRVWCDQATGRAGISDILASTSGGNQGQSGQAAPNSTLPHPISLNGSITGTMGVSLGGTRVPGTSVFSAASLPASNRTNPFQTSSAVGTSSSSISGRSSNPFAPISTSSSSSLTPSPGSRQPNPRSFRESPFYKVSECILAKPFDCRSGHAQVRVTVSNDHIKQLKASPLERIMLFVGPESGIPVVSNPFPGRGIPIEYPTLKPQHQNAPNHCTITVNSFTVPARSYMGIKGQPWSAQPLDLTDFVFKSSSILIDIRFTPDSRRLLICVQLVRRIVPAEVAEGVRRNSVLSKEAVMEQLGLVVPSDDDEVIATSQLVSLKDPITKCRIQTPTRGRSCKHSQCFDLDYYLQMNNTHPTWTCPVCSKHATWENLVVDKFFDEILRAATSSADYETAEIDPNGMWHLKQPAESAESSRSPSPLGGFAKHLHAETVAVEESSRDSAQRRPVDVIDLTLSDEEEVTVVPLPMTSITTNGTSRSPLRTSTTSIPSISSASTSFSAALTESSRSPSASDSTAVSALNPLFAPRLVLGGPSSSPLSQRSFLQQDGPTLQPLQQFQSPSLGLRQPPIASTFTEAYRSLQSSAAGSSSSLFSASPTAVSNSAIPLAHSRPGSGFANNALPSSTNQLASGERKTISATLPSSNCFPGLPTGSTTTKLLSSAALRNGSSSGYSSDTPDGGISNWSSAMANVGVHSGGIAGLTVGVGGMIEARDGKRKRPGGSNDDFSVSVRPRLG
ncbi:hypothetical protein DFJ73DRAFT_845778 [Zopfochytrium polystomum]|nr:hypothetical protein DFJ73DRAFT_845778 [Zopfochytrium polystomum]